jgi:DNA repair exonuclease SbcCD ATPase subunit
MRSIVQCTCRALLMVLVVMIMFLASSGNGEAGGYLFQWTDDSGTAHITDSLDKVPNQYRSRVQSLRQSDAAGDEGGGQNVQAAPRGETGGDGGAAEAAADQKEAWQRRVRSAQARLADAENRMRALEQQKQSLSSQWGAAGAALPPQQVLDQLNQIEGDLARTRQEIDGIRNEITVTIPDEARKAGIPPGWLREVE